MRFIKKRKEYLDIYSKNKKIETDYFILKWKPELLFAVGITITKKVGNAVKRNLLKRRIKSFLFLDSSCTFKDIEAAVVVIAKIKATAANFNEICRDLDKGFKILKNRL